MEIPACRLRGTTPGLAVRGCTESRFAPIARSGGARAPRSPRSLAPHGERAGRSCLSAAPPSKLRAGVPRPAPLRGARRPWGRAP